MRRMQVCSRPLNCACFRSGWILEPSITTTRSRRLRRTSVALAFFACFLSVTSLAKQTEEEKAAKAAAAQEKLLQVFVSEPYLELSTGPGRGYPVFHVVEREQSVDVLTVAPTGSRCAPRAASKAGHVRATCAAPSSPTARPSSSISATARATPRTTGNSASAVATTAARTSSVSLRRARSPTT